MNLEQEVKELKALVHFQCGRQQAVESALHAAIYAATTNTPLVNAVRQSLEQTYVHVLSRSLIEGHVTSFEEARGTILKLMDDAQAEASYAGNGAQDG